MSELSEKYVYRQRWSVTVSPARIVSSSKRERKYGFKWLCHLKRKVSPILVADRLAYLFVFIKRHYRSHHFGTGGTSFPRTRSSFMNFGLKLCSVTTKQSVYTSLLCKPKANEYSNALYRAQSYKLESTFHSNLLKRKITVHNGKYFTLRSILSL